jgi:hypothetical protein
MPQKLGELLKEQGVVTAAQLDTALRAQLFYGGHIGTCMMELGQLEEDTLGNALARLAHVPYAPAKVILNIPAKTIKAFPRKLAEKYRAVPIALEEGTLHLCLTDPRNLEFLDEIAFGTGRRVKAWVAPEARIYQALDRYYGIRRTTRYITLCRTLDAVEQAREHAQSEGRAASPAKDQKEHVSGPSRSGRAIVPDVAPEVAAHDLGGEYGYGRSWKEIATDIGLERRRQEGTQVREIVRAAQRPAHPGTISPTLYEATDRLCRTESKQDAVDAVLEFTAARMARSIFFGVNNDVASVWDTRGSDFDRRRRSKAVFPVDSEKLFTLLQGEDSYRGPLPSRENFVSFYSDLGMCSPKEEIMLIPIYMDDHLVAIFYGDGGASDEIVGETEEYLRLFRILPIAIHQILLRDSMRAIGYYFSDEAAEKSVAVTSSK